ncbi:sugar MFS transporter [Mucilaginibacter sp. L3T2-6]|uniref:sugar MFS transporter n=1 Tax=Mucilaginibacter sp. L3T2-6 TaxID=3062491 RepID=UPI002676949D|nr:sugar MFS transporter [Mucilaginibacter sp. L3T2-6]MDO3640997.1 sugar MFS transporter [Mucilaginibacter sp. L3T2-6]MDV6213527.1 sugar MFS transporter [Mucilaginibacter sp. L3T2-6]
MKRSYYIVALILLTFFVISFITNIIGPLSPAFISDFKLSDFMAGVLPFAFFIAYGVMSIPSSMLVQKYNEKTIMVTAFVVAFLGSLLLAAQPNYLTAILSLFLIGCGMAMLQVVINPLLRTAGGEENYAFTSVLAQLIFGGASFLSPLVYSYMVLNLGSKNHSGIFSVLSPLVPAGMPWISLYWLFVVICLLMAVLMLVSRFPKVELAEDEKAGAWETHVMLFKRPVVILYFIALFCYVGTEQGVSYWMSEFLKRYHHVDPEVTGAKAVAWFWGLMTAGGVLGLFLLKLMDSRRLLVVFTIFALIFLSLGLFGSAEVSLYSFSIVGFFMSVMYPIIFSLALSSVDEHHGSFAGILVTGIIGGAVVQILIGGLGNLIGLRAGMCFLYLTFGYMLAIGFWAKPLITNKTIFDKKE